LCPDITGVLSGVIYKDTITPFMRASPSTLNNLPKAYLLIPALWGLGFHIRVLGYTHIQSAAMM
jgi:hypothetical protein